MHDSGFIALLLVVAASVGVFTGHKINESQIRNEAGYYECIKSLPRDQNCILIAMPKEMNNE